MATSYLTKTFSSAGSTTTGTISFWARKAKNSSKQTIYHSVGASTSEYFRIGWESDNKIAIEEFNGSTNDIYKITTRTFTDTTNWYHIVLAIDTTDATEEDRIKLYVNGTRETSFGTNTNPSSSYASRFLKDSARYIGSSEVPNLYLDGGLTHMCVVDNSAEAVTVFGQTDATTGEWKPRTSPSVTYGTNGFFLKFENAGTIGTDSSGNGHTFSPSGNLLQSPSTPSNIFCTYDASIPQAAGVSGRNASANPLLTNNNRTNGTDAAYPVFQQGTFFVNSGKWYIEFKVASTTALSHGIVNDLYTDYSQSAIGKVTTTGVNNIGWDGSDGVIYKNNVGNYAGNTYGDGDIIMIALDLDNNKVYFGKNGTWENSGDPTSGSTGTGAITIDNDNYTFASISNGTGGASYSHMNAGGGYFGTTALASGQADNGNFGTFEYTPPTDYYSLCTSNINAQT